MAELNVAEQLPEAPATEADESHLEGTATNEAEGFQENSEQKAAELQAELDPEVTEEKPAEEPKEKTPSRAQARFDQLTEQRRDAERRAFAAEQELQFFKSKLPPEPNEDDFKYYKDFVRATSLWAANQAQIDVSLKQVKDSVQQIQSVDTEYQRVKMTDGVETYPDFAEKAKALGQIFEPGMEAYDALFDSQFFPEVAYFLSNNLAEANRIAQLPTRQQTREIIKLESVVMKGETPTPLAQDLPKPVKVVSAAPAPARQVLTGKIGSQRLDPNKETMEQYAARRSPELRIKK